MSGFSKPKRAADALNRHGDFTARVIQNDLAVEIRLADSGEALTTLWAPEGRGDSWVWTAGLDLKTYPSTNDVDELVACVAASLTGGTK